MTKCYKNFLLAILALKLSLLVLAGVSVPGVKPGWEGTGRIRPTTVQRPEVLEESLAALNYIVSCVSVSMLILN